MLARPDTRVGWMRAFSRAARARSGDAECYVRRAHVGMGRAGAERGRRRVRSDATRASGHLHGRVTVALAPATADGTARSDGGRRYGRARRRPRVRTCERAKRGPTTNATTPSD